MLFHDQFTAEEVLKKIMADSSRFKCDNSKAGILKISKRKTKLEKKRNYGLARADEILTEQVASRGPNAVVKIIWDKRLITVGDVEAFTQLKDDEVGNFCGEFVTVKFTDRK